MRVDVARYFRLKIAPILYTRAAADHVCKAKGHVLKFFLRSDKGPALETKKDGNDRIKLDILEKKHSPRRLLLVLAFSILMCGLFIKYLFYWFPLPEKDMPLIVSGLLIVFLSPVLYAFFYRPMVRQFEKLRIIAAMMRDLAHMDVLTGLYNRRGFLTYADHLLKLSNRTKRGLILIYADLDNMKQINDEFGHEHGDRALVAAAEVLKKTFRSSDVVGRVGGDEFAILALEAKVESLEALRERLNENLRRARYNASSVNKLKFSLGITLYDPDKPQAIEDLLKMADTLMYQNKAVKGTSGFSLCHRNKKG
jgi:diguanylate cyclase (GGDEF)-like protein